MRPTLLLRLQDPDKTFDPAAVPHQKAVPASGKLGRVQIGVVCHREKQAVRAAVVGDKGGHVQPQLERQPGLGPGGWPQPVQGVGVNLVPEMAFFPVSNEAGSPRN